MSTIYNGKVGGGKIEKIEILRDGTNQERITIYVNGNYSNPMKFIRDENWKTIYKLAEGKKVSFDKNLYNYFNRSKLNPLYEAEGFDVTEILKEKSGLILPNIEIKITTKNKMTQRLNSLSR